MATLGYVDSVRGAHAHPGDQALSDNGPGGREVMLGRAGPRWGSWVAARGVRATRPRGRGPRSSSPRTSGSAENTKVP